MLIAHRDTLALLFSFTRPYHISAMVSSLRDQDPAHAVHRLKGSDEAHKSHVFRSKFMLSPSFFIWPLPDLASHQTSSCSSMYCPVEKKKSIRMFRLIVTYIFIEK
jgi:hypothetical protein